MLPIQATIDYFYKLCQHAPWANIQFNSRAILSGRLSDFRGTSNSIDRDTPIRASSEWMKHMPNMRSKYTDIHICLCLFVCWLSVVDALHPERGRGGWPYLAIWFRHAALSSSTAAIFWHKGKAKQRSSVSYSPDDPRRAEFLFTDPCLFVLPTPPAPYRFHIKLGLLLYLVLFGRVLSISFCF